MNVAHATLIISSTNVLCPVNKGGVLALGHNKMRCETDATTRGSWQSDRTKVRRSTTDERKTNVSRLDLKRTETCLGVFNEQRTKTGRGKRRARGPIRSQPKLLSPMGPRTDDEGVKRSATKRWNKGHKGCSNQTPAQGGLVFLRKGKASPRPVSLKYPV